MSSAFTRTSAARSRHSTAEPSGASSPPACACACACAGVFCVCFVRVRVLCACACACARACVFAHVFVCAHAPAPEHACTRALAAERSCVLAVCMPCVPTCLCRVCRVCRMCAAGTRGTQRAWPPLSSQPARLPPSSLALCPSPHNAHPPAASSSSTSACRSASLSLATARAAVPKPWAALLMAEVSARRAMGCSVRGHEVMWVVWCAVGGVGLGVPQVLVGARGRIAAVA